MDRELSMSALGRILMITSKACYLLPFRNVFHPTEELLVEADVIERNYLEKSLSEHQVVFGHC